MFKVGITGGIGSGKSHIAKVFSELNVAVYDADYYAKFLMENDAEVILAIKKLLGDNAFINNRLNRNYIATQIFKDDAMRESINKIVHPAVGRHFSNWCLDASSPYIIKEAAIMFESGANVGLDFIIAVSSPMELRLQRVIKRDGMTKEKFDAIVKNQMSDEERNSKADAVIVNDESTPLLEMILNLHQFFLSKCR
jgi:dephospho-CoA kinase